MYKSLRFFNFGPDIIRWIKTLYYDAKLCVIQNGYFSKFFNIGRGCRQGDPVSSYIFNICVEIMGIMVRQNNNIKGIHIGEEVCLLQYADDTALFLEGSEKCLKSALDLLFQFSKYSGLKPNITKTKAVWIGSKAHSEEVLCKTYNLEWSDKPFTILGLTLTPDLQNIEDLNFGGKLVQIEKEIHSWNKRKLSPLGKITVIKSLLLPKLTHLFITLPKPSETWISNLEKTLFRFIWHGKPDKISRKLLQQDFHLGGCRMTHINSFIKSLKLTWFRRLINETGNTLKSIFNFICKCDFTHLCQFGPDYSKKLSKITDNQFWKEFLTVLHEFTILTSKKFAFNVLQNPLWYNPKISIDGKSIFIKSLFKNGFHIVSDLFKENGCFISYEDLKQNNNIKIPFTSFLGLKKSILKTWPYLHVDESLKHTERPQKPDFICIILKTIQGSKYMYDLFLENIQYISKHENKWKSVLNLDNTFIFKPYYKLLHQCTKDSKLKWFQYRIMYRILGTNKNLFDCKIKTNSVCNLCRSSTETIEHLFFQCHHTQQIWIQLKQWTETCYTNLNLSIDNILFGIPGKSNNAINVILLIVKYYIFSKSRKNSNLSFNELQHSIFSYYIAEKNSYAINKKQNDFNIKWNAFKIIIDNLHVS